MKYESMVPVVAKSAQYEAWYTHRNLATQGIRVCVTNEP